MCKINLWFKKSKFYHKFDVSFRNPVHVLTVYCLVDVWSINFKTSQCSLKDLN